MEFSLPLISCGGEDLIGPEAGNAHSVSLMKTRLLALLAGVAALLAFSSCIESHQTLKLKKDGSGTIEEETLMGAQMVAMMEMAALQGGGADGPNPLGEMYDEEKYKKKASGYGEGVEYVKLEKIERNGGKGVKVIYKFKDVNTVKFEPGSGLDDVGPGAGAPPAADAGEVPEATLKFNYAGGKLTITFPDSPEGVEKPAEEDLPNPVDEQAQQMMQMFKDMKISAKLVVESGIASTNATHRDGDAITLMAVNFAEVMENPDGMNALQKLDMQDRKEMEKALKDMKGVKMETKKIVEVTLK